jgi:hypothetical protein
MNVKSIITSFLLLLLVCLASCHPEKHTLRQATDEEASALQDELNKQTDSTSNSTKSIFQSTGSAGDQQAFWQQALKACFDNNATAHNTIFTKRLIYLGPSSNKYLGTIFDSKARTRRTLASIIPLSEFIKFTDTGVTVNNCDLTHVKKITLDFVLGGGVLSALDANLSSAFNSADSTVITGGSWRQDDFRIDNFLDYVDSVKSLADYKETLFKDGNKVITLVYRVGGFSAKAYISKGISVDLQAKLSNTIKVLVPGIDSASASIKFSSASKNEINISSNNSFYIFANVWVGSDLKQ